MVRTDQSQIPSILDETFQELYNEMTQKVNEQLFVKHFEPFFKQCKIFLYGQINFEIAAAELKKAQNGSKGGVCAKTLKAGDVAWKCEDCELDPTCIICQDCFEKGNHKGHRVWLKKNVSGCCDCGDPDAWRENGFCSDHKGYEASSEALMESMPMFMKNSAKHVFEFICKQLKLQCLNLQHFQIQFKQGMKSEELIAKIFTTGLLIIELFKFFEWSIEASPALINFITEAIGQTYFDSIKPKESHKCCYRGFINEEEKRQYLMKVKGYLDELNIEEEDPIDSNLSQITQDDEYQRLMKKLALAIDLKKICVCNSLDLTFQTNHFMLPAQKTQIYEFYFKLFQSFKFKQLLGLSFAANFEVITIERPDSHHNIGSIGVQILTIDEIGLMIMKEAQYRQCIINTYDKVMNQMIESDYNEKYANFYFHMLFDLKYLCRPKTLNYIIYETTFLESILEQLIKFYFTDTVSFRETHVMFDSAVYKESLINIDIQLSKIYKGYLKELDPSNLQRNRRLMSAFIVYFQDINERFASHLNKGFFCIPLHRAFSYYLSRLVMYNYIKDKERFQHKKPKDIMVDIMRKYVECKPGQNVLNYIQSAITSIICPLAAQWSFNHQILSGKWVMSGLYINQLPRLIYMVFEYYLLLEMGLFQLLIAVSPEPEQTINNILQTFELDSWMKTLYQNICTKSLSADAFKQFKPVFDVKKLRQMLHWQFRFLIQLSQTEIGFLYPLLTDLERKDPLFYQEEKITKQIEGMFKKDLRRNIIHTLIQFAGRADIKDLKKGSEKLYVESSYYEDALLEVAEPLKDKSKLALFKLKDQYLNQFEPYYYMNPESIAKVTESVQNMQNEKQKQNDILGDYQGNYTFSTDINNLVRDALTQSTFATYLKEFLVIWTSEKKQDFEVIDEQVGHECLKLLWLMICSAQQNTYNQKNFLVQVLLSNDSEVITSLLKLKEQGEAMNTAVDIILRGIYDIDPIQFVELGQKLGINDQELKQQNQISQQLKEEEQKQKKETMKEAARLKKEQIMQKFQGKRQNYISKQSQSSISVQLNRTNSSMTEKISLEDGETNHCSLCKEELSLDNFFSEPYGQFAYLSRSKLMSHTLKQTLQLQNEIISKFNTNCYQQSNDNIQEQNQVEEEKESYQQQINDQVTEETLRTLDLSYLTEHQKTGGTIIKCSHYSHYKCLNDYLITNESDIRKRESRKLIGLDFNNFQCPLCRHLSNGLIPCDTLQNYNERKFDQSDFNQIDLLQIYSNFLSKIFKSQTKRRSDTLLIDIKKEPLEALEVVSDFIEHRLQLIDIKGTQEFLKPSKHHVNRDQYETILDMTYNLVKIVMDSGINLRGDNSQDEDMTEFTFDEICVEKLRKLLEKHTSSSNQNILFQTDLFSHAFKVLYFIYMLFQEKQGEFLGLMQEVISAVYKLNQVQALLRIMFMVNKGQLNGTNSYIYQQFDANNLYELSKKPELQEYLIRAQLPFLRKVMCLKVMMTQRFAFNDPQLHTNNNQIIDTLLHIHDDHDEYEFLRAQLNLNDFNYDFLIKQEQGSTNIKAQQQADNNMEEESAFDDPSNYYQIESLECQLSTSKDELSNLIKQSLSKISALDFIKKQIDDWVVFSQLGFANFARLSKEQILESEYAKTLYMPNQLKLQDTYFTFKLKQLPQDFQSLIQEYYKQKCKNCNKQPKEACLCLLCGETLCFVQKCCQNLPGMRDMEGDLTFHSRTCEGGMSLFINISSGKIVFIEGDRSCQKNSPYINKFGETYSNSSKKWDNFYLDESTGGAQIYEDYRKMYMNFTISNEIIKYRSSNDYVWRLRMV
eukprot:403348132